MGKQAKLKQQRRASKQPRYKLKVPKELRDVFTQMALKRHGPGPAEFTAAMLDRFWDAAQYDSWDAIKSAGAEFMPNWVFALITLIESDLQFPVSSAADANEETLAQLETAGAGAIAAMKSGAMKP